MKLTTLKFWFVFN